MNQDPQNIEMILKHYDVFQSLSKGIKDGVEVK